MEIIAIVAVVLFVGLCVKCLKPRKQVRYDIGNAPKYGKRAHGR